MIIVLLYCIIGLIAYYLMGVAITAIMVHTKYLQPYNGIYQKNQIDDGRITAYKGEKFSESDQQFEKNMAHIGMPIAWPIICTLCVLASICLSLGKLHTLFVESVFNKKESK